MFSIFCRGFYAFFLLCTQYTANSSFERGINFTPLRAKVFLVMAGVMVFFSTDHSIAAIQWKEAFPQPRGIILIDEINQDRLPFYMDHKHKKVKIGGRFADYRFAEDFTSATIYAREVFNVGVLNRDAFYRCRTTTSRNELKRISKIQNGSQIIFEGTLVDLSDGIFTLEDCKVLTDVNMFHERDTSIIEGSWCNVYNGVTYDVTTYKKLNNGLFRQTVMYSDGSKMNKNVQVSREGNRFKFYPINDDGSRGYGFRRNLISIFNITDEFSILGKPAPNKVTRCTVTNH